MDKRWQFKLIVTLMEMPVLRSPTARGALLRGIGTETTRDHTSVWSDLSHIIGELIVGQDLEGLCTLIDNALLSRPVAVHATTLKALRAELTAPSTEETPAANHPVGPESFDLDEQCVRCLDEILGPRSLVGIGLRHRAESVRNHLRRRLIDGSARDPGLGRGKVCEDETFKLDPLHWRPEDLVNSLKQRKRNLMRRHVLTSIDVEHAEYVGQFWDALEREFHEKFDHKLIVLLCKSDEAAFPTNVRDLGPLTFSQEHLTVWLRKVINSVVPEAKIPQHFEWRWSRYTVRRCTRTTGVNPDMLYHDLRLFLDMLREDRCLDVFDRMLKAQGS